MQKINNKEITITISGLHAEAIAIHLLIVMKNFIPTMKEANLSEPTSGLLNNLDQVYEKLNLLSSEQDDEAKKQIHLSIPQAEAIIQAFISEPLKSAALQDPYYQQKSYSEYFEQIYASYLKLISVDYVLTLAA